MACPSSAFCVSVLIFGSSIVGFLWKQSNPCGFCLSQKIDCPIRHNFLINKPTTYPSTMSCTTTTTTTNTQSQTNKIAVAVRDDDVQTIRSHRLLTLATITDLYGNNIVQMAYLMDSPNVFNYLIRENQVFDGQDMLQHVNHRGDNIYKLCIQRGDAQTISTLHNLDKTEKQKTIENYANKIRSLEADNTKLIKENDKLQTTNDKYGNAIRVFKQDMDKMETELEETKRGLKRKCEELDVEKEKVEMLRKSVRSNQEARKK